MVSKTFKNQTKPWVLCLLRYWLIAFMQEKQCCFLFLALKQKKKQLGKTPNKTSFESKPNSLPHSFVFSFFGPLSVSLFWRDWSMYDISPLRHSCSPAYPHKLCHCTSHCSNCLDLVFFSFFHFFHFFPCFSVFPFFSVVLKILNLGLKILRTTFWIPSLLMRKVWRIWIQFFCSKSYTKGDTVTRSIQSISKGISTHINNTFKVC